MGDSDLSASELRNRYHNGGTAKDDELTAAQLRARHGLAPNRKGLIFSHRVQFASHECFRFNIIDFSTSDNSQSGNLIVVVIVAVLVVVGVGAYLLLNK